MRLKKLNMTNDFPLIISLHGKTNSLGEDSVFVERNEDTCCYATICDTELLPSKCSKRIRDIIVYFSEICDEGMSPQCMWGTENCVYISLMLDVNSTNENEFDAILNKFFDEFSDLKNEEKFYMPIPCNADLKDYVSYIAVSYPETWDVEYELYRRTD